MEPLSTHLPSVAGGVEPVIGEAIVDTGLRKLRTVLVSFKAPNFPLDEESKVSWYPVPGESLTTVRIVIRVEKGGANDGLLGTNLVQISWLALGE